MFYYAYLRLFAGVLLLYLGGFCKESYVLLYKLASFVSQNPVKQKQLSGCVFALAKPNVEVGIRILPLPIMKACLSSMCLKG